MLTRIGIDTEVVTMPRSVYFKRASRGGPDKHAGVQLHPRGLGIGHGRGVESPLQAR